MKERCKVTGHHGGYNASYQSLPPLEIVSLSRLAAALFLQLDTTTSRHLETRGDREHGDAIYAPRLSVRRQSALLALTRSSLFYEPQGECAENLWFMEIIRRPAGDLCMQISREGSAFFGGALVRVAPTSRGISFGNTLPVSEWLVKCSATTKNVAVTVSSG